MRKEKIESRKEERADKPKVRDFTELQTWKTARNLRAEIYRVSRTFPGEEKFGLVSQMRRAAVSVTANLAEGYGRYSFQENIQFCRHSRASAYEVRDHLTTALDAEYISQEKYVELEGLAMDVVRLVNGYFRSTKKLKDDANK